MTYENFLIKLKKYQPYEETASEKICLLNSVSVLNFNNNYKYDFETSDNIKYEVKADEMALKTGNFFIEFLGYGKSSGIATTEAKFYIISDTKIYYLIDVEALKKIIIDKPILTTRDGLTMGHIVKRNIIKENSVLI
jgi:hypothetical protein